MKDTLRNRIIVELSCDENKMFQDVRKTIEYLSEMADKYPDIRLDQHWITHDEKGLFFYYLREETDEEFEKRLKNQAISMQIKKLYREYQKQTEELQRKLR